MLNSLKVELSLIVPRPQLLREMVFMTKRQRMRHKVMPGLSGLAQINGRNGITWEEKLEIDLKYIKRITFFGDLKIIIFTIVKAFIKQEGITMRDMETSMDYGDYLLKSGRISQNDYEKKQYEAIQILDLLK